MLILSAFDCTRRSGGKCHSFLGGLRAIRYTPRPNTLAMPLRGAAPIPAARVLHCLKVNLTFVHVPMIPNLLKFTPCSLIGTSKYKITVKLQGQAFACPCTTIFLSLNP